MEIVGAIRTCIPGASITTDIIVGFPSESEEDYDQTLDLVMSVLFEDAFTYIYSERLFEKARNIPEKIPPEISKKRIETLIMLQRRISYDKNTQEIGTQKTALTIGESKKDPSEMLCKTETGKMVVVNTKAPTGRFLDIRVTGISGNTLRGKEIS